MLGGCLAALLVLSVAGCARKPPPNVVVVTLDTTRYDSFGCHGDSDARTPILDGLAARGVDFDRAYASTPLTLPSHATILTGLEPLEHGVRNNGSFKLSERFETLAERLKGAGYDTAAFVSAMVLHGRYGLKRGFDIYEDDIASPRRMIDFSVPRRNGDQTTNAALGWLDARRSEDRPFFLWVHYYDAHAPYHAGPSPDALPDSYAAALSYQDAQLGRLLDGVAKVEGARGTLVIVTADHGESLGEHAETTHGTIAYDSTLHVPLVVAGAGVPQGKRSAALARHVDILPTIAESAGLRLSQPLLGRSLLRLATNPPDPDGTIGYFESHGPHYDLGWSKIEGVRSVRWKYTAAPDPVELYDIESDPHELRNLAEAQPEMLAEMEERWREFLQDHGTEPSDAEIGDVSLETREQLAALGYVQARQDFATGEAPDPRKYVAARDWVESAAQLASLGRYAEAINSLEALVQSPSVEVLVLRTLGPVYAAVGRVDDAIAIYRRDIELTGSEEAHLGLAKSLARAGRLAESLTELESLDSTSVKVATERAVTLVKLGRGEEARELIDRALAGPELQRERLLRRSRLVIEAPPSPEGEAELRQLLKEAPDDTTLKSRLGVYLVRLGRRDRAEEALSLVRSASVASPDDFDLLSQLGWTAYELGNDEEALEAFEAALRLGGRRPGDLFWIAFPLLRQGDRETALASLREALEREPGASWAGKARRMVAQIEKGSNGDTNVGVPAEPSERANEVRG